MSSEVGRGGPVAAEERETWESWNRQDPQAVAARAGLTGELAEDSEFC